MMNSASILYGGDEIGALVFDPGHQSLRLGFAQVKFLQQKRKKKLLTQTIFFIIKQEDSPKSEIPSVVGVGPNSSANGINEPEIKSDNNVTPSSKLINYCFLLRLDHVRMFDFRQILH